MTGEIVNLRRVRKAKARLGDAGKAAENRAFFGRTKAERILTAATEAQAVRRLDGHLIATSPVPGSFENDDA